MRYLLPYAFARTHQVLLEEREDILYFWHHEKSSPSAISEVLRKYPQIASMQLANSEELIQRISEAYASGESNAASVVSEVQSDIDRIEAIWNQARTDFAPITGGDYLFGEFSIADAMFAPVIWRFNSYNVQLNGPAQEYMQTMLAHPNMQEWRLDALAETTAIAHYDENAKKLHGESRV